MGAKTTRRRLKLRRRYGKECWFCGLATGNTIDHMVATSRGGARHLGNLALACKSCNGAKGNQTIIPVKAFVIFGGYNDWGKLFVMRGHQVKVAKFYRALTKRIQQLRSMPARA